MSKNQYIKSRIAIEHVLQYLEDQFNDGKLTRQELRDNSSAQAIMMNLRYELNAEYFD